MPRKSSFRSVVMAVAVLSAASAHAQVQSPEQQTCLDTVNKSLSSVAKTNASNAASCLKAAASGKLPSGQSAVQCLTADNAGKVAKTDAKVVASDTSKCTMAPDYGYLAPTALSATGARESRALVRDLFGVDLDAAVIDAESDKAGAGCQAAGANAAAKILQTALGLARSCEKAGFKAGTIDEAGDLVDCLGTLATDPSGKLAKAVTKAGAAIAKKCGTTAVALAFPGSCSAAGDFGACAGTLATCHACLAANDGDGAVADCDMIDNGAADGSCCVDADEDGSSACLVAPDDCDDTDASMHPGAEEVCDAVDNDCNLVADDYTVESGESCGTSDVAPCSAGSVQCVSGALQCTGAVEPLTESCNGLDDNCDGATDTGLATPECKVPAAPPVGATSACAAGTLTCSGGVYECAGSTGPSSLIDTCGVDANCDGQLTSQPDLQSDRNNCGSCGNVCGTGSAHSVWTCDSGTCTFQGCQAGYQDNNADQSCETPCTFTSAQESCNGVDDNCNGSIDEGVVAPSPAQVCGVSPWATATECTSGVTVTCQGGAWACTFPAGVCSGGCSPDDEICDSLDNDCDGSLNENVLGYGAACASDDGLPAPGDGPCRTTGTMVCNGASAVQCSAVKANCNDLPGGCTELCDGVDNDCDGSVDEAFNAKGGNSAFFVKPVVTKLASSLWMYSNEASRPSATSSNPGTGNGFWTTAPSGKTLDKTRSCSKSGVLPWFNVTPNEAEQTCTAMGGSLCTTTQYQSACNATASCTFGYAPRGSACTSSYTVSKFCNLGPSYDFNSGTFGDQDNLLPTASAALSSCYADWSALQGNTASTNKLFDLTGNLREITKNASPGVYNLMGGAFNNDSEAGAACSFSFYAVNNTFQYFDTGFRCCFTSDPTL